MYALTVMSTHFRDIGDNKIPRMKQMRSTANNVAKNLKWLKEAAGDTYRHVEQRSGVARSVVQRIITGEQSATVEQAESLAKAYGLEGWHLLLPNLPADVAETQTLSKLVNSYFSASPGGKDNISRIAELESRYSADAAER